MTGHPFFCTLVVMYPCSRTISATQQVRSLSIENGLISHALTESGVKLVSARRCFSTPSKWANSIRSCIYDTCVVCYPVYSGRQSTAYSDTCERIRRGHTGGRPTQDSFLCSSVPVLHIPSAVLPLYFFIARRLHQYLSLVDSTVDSILSPRYSHSPQVGFLWEIIPDRVTASRLEPTTEPLEGAEVTD